MTVYTIGRRKEAKARAAISTGSGRIRINKESVHNLPHIVQKKIREPVILADNPDDIDIQVNVEGGGLLGQADAARTAIARGLVSYYTESDLKATFDEYDRYMLVEDSRRTEPHKPSQSSKGPRHKRQKSYR